MSYSRTIPAEQNTGLGPKVEKHTTPGPEWVPTDNPMVERNTRDGTFRTRDCRPTEDDLVGLPVDIAYAMRKIKSRAALDELAAIDRNLGL